MEPRVRARHMKSLLASVDRLSPDDARSVLAHLSLPTRREIEDATGVDWLPAARNLELTRAVYLGLGEVRGGRFFQETLREAFSGPLLRIVIEAAQRVFRVDVASFAGWVGTGWVLLFRDCGRWKVDRVGEREATVLIEGLPPEFARDRFWLDSVASSLSAFFDFVGSAGTVRFEGHDPDTSRARYRISWS